MRTLILHWALKLEQMKSHCRTNFGLNSKIYLTPWNCLDKHKYPNMLSKIVRRSLLVFNLHNGTKWQKDLVAVLWLTTSIPRDLKGLPSASRSVGFNLKLFINIVFIYVHIFFKVYYILWSIDKVKFGNTKIWMEKILNRCTSGFPLPASGLLICEVTLTHFQHLYYNGRLKMPSPTGP
jgi:hypothetical protein